MESFIKKLALLMPNEESIAVSKELFDLDKCIVFLRAFGKEEETLQRLYHYNLMEVRKTGEVISDGGNYKFLLTKENLTKIKIYWKKI